MLRYTSAVIIVAPLLLASSKEANAGLSWNIVGNYVFNFEVQDGNYNLPVDIVSQDPATGTFVATTSSPNTTITGGTFENGQISFYDNYPVGTTQFYGPISVNGTFSGTVVSNNGHGPFYGGFSTASGQATQVEAPDFEIFENVGSSNCPNLPSGSTGCFTLVNNTSNYAVNGFDVGNPLALSASTTRSNWSADITSLNFGSGLEPTFAYFDQGGIAANPLVNGSDSSFYYTTSASGSPFEVSATGPNGVTVSCSGTTGNGCDLAVPEPSTLPLFGAGLAALWLILSGRWRLSG